MQLIVISMMALLSSPGTPHTAFEIQYVNDAAHLFVSLTDTLALGPSAASPDTTCGYLGLAFDAGDVGYVGGSAQPCWNEDTDIIYRIVVWPTQADKIQVGETIIMTLSYRTPAPFASLNGGAQAVATGTYTQAIAESLECQQLFIDLVLDRTDTAGGGAQSMVVNDAIVGDLVVTGTYSGDPVIGAVIEILTIHESCHQG